MKLIGSTTSPYVRKLRVALLEKKLPFEFVIDSPWEAGNHVSDYNPLGKVPAMVTDDGEVLFDSNVLLAYVETLGAAPALLPADPRAAIAVRQTAALADGMTDAAVALLLESRRAPEKQDEGWIARQRGKLVRGLDALETRLDGRSYFHDETLSIADIATVCGLTWIDFRQLDPQWRSGRPRLAGLVERLAARASFQQTVPAL